MPVMKKYIPCCVCNGVESIELYEDELQESVPPVDYDFTPETRKTYRIVKCKACGHIFTSPMPFFKEIYEESSNDLYQKSKKQRVKTFTKIRDLLSRYKKSGKVLDIGCATGLLLDVFSTSFETYGVEPSEWSRKRCDQKHKVVPSLEQLSNKRYDVITLLGVIEHLQHPGLMISTISEMLAEDGFFLIYTGDVEAILPKVMGKKWWWYQGMHLHYFSRSTLERMLDRYGIDILEYRNMPLYFSMESLCTSMNRYAFLNIFSRVLMVPLIRNLILPLPLSGEMLLLCKKRA